MRGVGDISEYLRHGLIDVVFLIFSFMFVMSYRQTPLLGSSPHSDQFLLNIPIRRHQRPHENSSYQAGGLQPAKYVIYVIFSILILMPDTGAAPHSDRRQEWIWHLRLKNISACGRIIFSFHSSFHVAVKSELRNVYSQNFAAFYLHSADHTCRSTLFRTLDCIFTFSVWHDVCVLISMRRFQSLKLWWHHLTNKITFNWNIYFLLLI